MKILFLFLYFLFLTPSFLLASKVPNVIIFESLIMGAIQERTDGLISHMEEKGFINGKTIRLHRINAQLNRNLGKKLLKETILKYTPSLVITNATVASQIAKEELEGTDIPLFFFGVTDPIGAGIVKKIGGAHKDLVTGSIHTVSSNTIFDLILKVLSTGSAIKPHKIGLIYSSYPSSYNNFKELQSISKNTDIQFVPIQVKNINDLQRSLNTTIEKFDYIWLTPGPFAISDKFVQHLIDITTQPIIFIEKMSHVKKGVLMAVDTNTNIYGREAGVMAVSILNGMSVTDMEVRRSKKFELGININTANKMNLIIPSDILDLAKRNLFK